jgi:hypothetical protein
MNFKSYILLPLLTFFLTSLTFTVIAQAPLQIPYQGVARDAQGVALQNQSITLLLAIEDITGAELFSETHSTTTNQFGLFNVKIGSVSNMPTNLWSNGDRFLHVKMDPTGGSVFTDLGTTQFLSVPYALYAETSNTPGPQGPAGPQGQAGANGIDGTNGQDGAQGPQGLQGIQGEVGPQGPAGANGLDGENGQDGEHGPQGIQGETGPQGPAGLNGTNGQDGAQGPQGIQGEMGPQGPAGMNGLDGTNGQDGVQGPQGATGNGITNISVEGNSLVFTLSDGSTQAVAFPAQGIGIGDFYQGGIIVYMLKPGDPGYSSSVPHGLIAPPIDQGTAIWGCDGLDLAGANQSVIGGGFQNTLDILAGCSQTNIAARICDNLVFNGYTDWYLPSSGELTKIFTTDNIGNFANTYYSNSYYWSSTENSASSAILVGVNTTLSNPNKADQNRVLAVRSF